jgi:Zn-dependent metalloprotease
MLAAPAAVCLATEPALAGEKRDLSGQSDALSRLQQMTAGKQFADPAELGTVTHQALGLESGSALKLERTSKLPNGKEVSRFEQTFRGIPVWGERIVVTRKQDGSVEKLGGKAIFDVGSAFADAMPAMTADQALEKAKSAASELKGNVGLKSFANADVRQVVYVEDSGSTHIAFEVNFTALASGPVPHPTRPYVLLDASTGKTLLLWEGLNNEAKGTGPGGNVKTGKYEYGAGKLPAIDVTVDGKQCSLKGKEVYTEDLKNSMQDGTNQPFPFPCYKNTAREANGAYSPLNDAHFLGTLIVEMYRDWFGAPPLPFHLHMRVHYGEKFANAFWLN